MCEPAYDENGKIIGIACPNATGHRGPEGPTGHRLPMRVVCSGCGKERPVPTDATSMPCSCGNPGVRTEALVGVVMPLDAETLGQYADDARRVPPEER